MGDTVDLGEYRAAEDGLVVAQAALARGDAEFALALWSAITERFPSHPDAYRQAASLLSSRGRHQEAEAILLDARSRVSTDLMLIGIDHARLAVRRRDLEEAARRWSMVRDDFPDHPAAYVGLAETLRDARRLDDAQTVLDTIAARFPGERAIPILRASLAGARGDLAAAVGLWEGVRARLPRDPIGYIEGADALRRAELTEAADALLADAIARFPDNAELAVLWARLAEAEGPPTEAARRWAAVRQRFPGETAGPAPPHVSPLALARLRAAEGQLEAAEAILRSAIEADPSTLELFTEYARLATRRKDWLEALRRWKDAQRRFPEAMQLGPQVFEAELRVVENVPTEQPAAPVQAQFPLSDDREELRTLMLNFESLGGTLQGCEFGLVQRACGAEPLGLLRWTEMGPKNLIEALEAGLEGVGLPENTELKVNQTPDGPEYVTVDKRFLMSMHTFVKETELPRERMFEQSCRRLRYLREKLLQDLHEGTKIFVYKITWRILTDDELIRMHEALRKHGNGTLLYVQRETPTKPHGTVELIKPGLMMGYIDRFNISAAGEHLGPSHDSWLPICRHAMALR